MAYPQNIILLKTLSAAATFLKRKALPYKKIEEKKRLSRVIMKAMERDGDEGILKSVTL